VRRFRPYSDRVDESAAPWHQATAALITAGEMVQPSGLGTAVNEAVRPMGVDVTIYLIDLEQRTLRALPRSGKPTPDSVSVEASIAGRAFMTIAPVLPTAGDARVWMPIVDGTERLGVADIRLPETMSTHDPQILDGLRVFMMLIGHLLVSKLAYGDGLRRLRRSQHMSVGGELLWRMLPPLTFATTNLALAAVIEPCYRVGGDAFDYAVDHDTARLSIFDAVGHDLNASITTTLTLAATRAARIQNLDLPAVATAADQALTSQFDDLRYTTAVLAELDLQRGGLRYLNAGHPATILIRRGKAVCALEGARRMPLGLIDSTDEVAEYSLEPGDRLLFHTDGITEARDAEGEPFGVSRLVDLAERHATAGLPAPEILRRLSHAVVDHQHGVVHDDATLMIVEWAPLAGTSVTP